MKKSTFVVVVLAGMLAFSVTAALALLSEEQREVLRGLERLHVVVERLRPDVEVDGLYQSTLETDAELTLRMAGIKVLSEEDSSQAPGAPDLYLKVNTLKCANGYVYNLRLSLDETVSLPRKGAQVRATVLNFGDKLGIAPRLSDLRDEVRDLLEDFIRAWQAANQK